jgi:TPP-dependent 2-oxoacid decarboxylase
VINAVAGAMSEHLPLICITGIPNSNDFSGDKILHHTIGDIDFTQELRWGLHIHITAWPFSSQSSRAEKAQCSSEVHFGSARLQS